MNEDSTIIIIKNIPLLLRKNVIGHYKVSNFNQNTYGPTYLSQRFDNKKVNDTVGFDVIMRFKSVHNCYVRVIIVKKEKNVLFVKLNKESKKYLRQIKKAIKKDEKVFNNLVLE